MNELEILADRIIKQFPLVKTEMSKPLKPNGHWFLDITFDSEIWTVEWRPNLGFGFCNCKNPEDHGYGEGPDLIYKDTENAFNKVKEFIDSKSSSS